MLGSSPDYDSDEDEEDGAARGSLATPNGDSSAVGGGRPVDEDGDEVLELGSAGGEDGGGSGRKIKMADALDLFHRILDIRRDQQRSAPPATATAAAADPSSSVGGGDDKDASSCPPAAPNHDGGGHGGGSGLEDGDEGANYSGGGGGGGGGADEMAPSAGGVRGGGREGCGWVGMARR